MLIVLLASHAVPVLPEVRQCEMRKKLYTKESLLRMCWRLIEFLKHACDIILNNFVRLFSKGI